MTPSVVYMVASVCRRTAELRRYLFCVLSSFLPTTLILEGAEDEAGCVQAGRVVGNHFALAMVMLFLAIGFALGVPTSPATTAASAIRHLQPDGTESVSDQTVLPDASGNCPQGTCPQGTCPQGTCPHGPKPAGTSSHGPKPAGTKPGGTKPGGTHPYEKRQNAIINSCVPDKSAPDCPMPPVCGDCGGEQECIDGFIIPSVAHTSGVPGVTCCAPSTGRTSAPGSDCDFGDKRSEEQQKSDPQEIGAEICTCTCDIDRSAHAVCE